ncbi:MAG TPA: polysaccharide biosynthesis C-terminal domain-containing protein [Chitinophagaceae bacterium]|nr:polysaccharide biosynthesis C-terminal domain-containing protein [Chitinophagaceae bacterium]
MGNIRKQTIVSSILVYLGFGIGAINTWIYTKQGGAFTIDQYALTRLFFDIGQLFFCFATLSSLTVLNKFYPYYKDNLPDNKNDLFTRTLVIVIIGCIVTTLACYVFEPLVVRKFSQRSKLFVDYYHWVLFFGVGLTFFSLLETYCWSLQKTILPSFLRETGLRLLTSLFIVLYFFRLVSFQTFIYLFSTMFLIMALILFVYLLKTKQLHIVLTVSRVTKKFRKKMLLMQWLTFGGITVIFIGQTIDGILIASLVGLKETGIYTLGQYAANLVQVPQRSIQAVSTGVIARAWKDKDYKEINRVYGRSSINMLLLGLFIFGNVWLNLLDGMQVLHIQGAYTAALQVILVIGATRIIDAGTGVNQTIIITSNRWTFEFYSGIIILALRVPLAYLLVKQYSMIGSAYAELIMLSIFNFVRFEFLRREYGMQPYSMKTIYTLLLGFGSYFVTYLLLNNLHGWAGVISRVCLFSALMVAGTFLLRLTPDAMQLFDNVKKRLGRA